MKETAPASDDSVLENDSGIGGDAAAPAEDDHSQTSEQLAEAKEYGRLTLRLALADMALDFVFLTLFALFLAQPLDAWLQGFPFLNGDGMGSRLLRLGAFISTYLALHVAVSIGLSYYRGYVVEHRYELSNQTRLRWLTQYAKRIAVTVVASLVMIGGLYAIMWLTGSWWWLVAAAAAFVVSVLIGYVTPVLILPLFVKYERIDDERLQQELAQLAEGTGLSIEGTYRLVLSADTKKANAMLAGLGRTRRVLLGDTLLENFSPEEIKVVMAHEIGHHVFGHIYKMLLGSIPYLLLSFLLCHWGLRWWLGDAFAPERGAVPVYAVSYLLLFVFVFGTLTGPLQNAVMRHFERQCDRYALERTRSPDAYRTAFTKLAKLNKADPAPPWLEVVLFDDHPPIRERLAMAERFAG